MILVKIDYTFYKMKNFVCTALFTGTISKETHLLTYPNTI